MLEEKKHSGSKYRKAIRGKHLANEYIRTDNESLEQITTIEVDIYDLLVGYEVTCPARQHAIKKLFFAGVRGGKGAKQDLEEAIDAIRRAIELLK